MTTRLRDLVGEPAGFFADVFGIFPYRYRASLDLVSSALIWDELECGLAVRPYFDLLRSDGPVRHDAYLTRNVVNNPLDGYPDVEVMRRHYAEGAAVVMPRAELWCAKLADLVSSLGKTFRAETWADCYLGTAVSAASAEAHAFALQIEGASTWSVGGSEPGNFTGTLTPGDIVYLPPGTTCEAAGTDQGSLVVMLHIREVTPRELAEVMAATFLRGPQAQQVAGNHHLMPMPEKVDWLRDALAAHLEKLDTKAVLETTRYHGHRH
jgi:hypothetical protein